MTKRVLSACMLFLLAAFLVSCIPAAYDRSPIKIQMAIPPNTQAEKFPAVLLRTKSGINKILKILRLDGEKVVVLPSPYWNIQPEEIALEEISSIELTEVPKRGAGPIAGFFLGYYAAGLGGLASAKYNDDYQQALASSFLSGLGCALLGLCMEVAMIPRPKTKFYFSRMSAPEKIEALKDIMGVR